MIAIRTALRRAASFFAPAWEVREEAAGGIPSFCIYRRQFGRARFFERWATLHTASRRVGEVRGKTPAGSVVSADRILAASDAPEAEVTGAHSPETRVYRGNRAREVLSNETFEWAFQTLRTEILESWQNAPEQDQQGREKLWLTLKLLDKVKSNLTARLETGKLAQMELRHRKKTEEQAKQWMA